MVLVTLSGIAGPARLSSAVRVTASLSRVLFVGGSRASSGACRLGVSRSQRHWAVIISAWRKAASLPSRGQLGRGAPCCCSCGAFCPTGRVRRPCPGVGSDRRGRARRRGCCSREHESGLGRHSQRRVALIPHHHLNDGAPNASNLSTPGWLGWKTWYPEWAPSTT